MIRLVFDNGVSETGLAKFRYKNLDAMNDIEFPLTAKRFKKLWLSGKCGFWQVYYLGWQEDIQISLVGEDVQIRVAGPKPGMEVLMTAQDIMEGRV
jgi:hypothetical protein